MNNTHERRTIDELVARYTLEPRLRDVYVEGSSDAAIVHWVLSHHDLADFAVYEIATVEVPSQLLSENRLENSNRGRVIGLALELERNLGPACNQATCIADRDFDAILRREHQCSVLLPTDYSSMEMYLFDASVVNKLLTLVLSGFPEPAEAVLSQLVPVLQELFFIRLVNYNLQLNLEWMSFERCCKADVAGLRFDCPTFITRYLSKNKALPHKQSFADEVRRCRQLQLPDPRYQMHGHDFVELLSWYLGRRSKNKQLCRPDFVRGALWACIEGHQLGDTDLFRRLMDRLSRPDSGF